MSKKNIVFSIALILILTLNSCRALLSLDEWRDDHYANLARGHEIYYGDFSEIVIEDPFEAKLVRNLVRIANWMRKKIYWRADEDGDEWRDGEETLRLGYGDCDDFAILFINIVYVLSGIKMDLVLTYVEPRIIVNGGEVNHAEMYYTFEGQLYNIYTGYPVDSRVIGYLFPFDYCFNKKISRNILDRQLIIFNQ